MGEDRWRDAVEHLLTAEPLFSSIVASSGPCVLGKNAEGLDVFARLATTILRKQLSGKAAAAIESRFRAVSPDKPFPEPADILSLTVEDLRSAGISRQKAGCLKELAAHALGVDGRRLPTFPDLVQMGDDEVVAALTCVKGIGRWSVEMLLMFDLGRPDVFPVSDLGIRRGMQELLRLREPPSEREMLERAEPWRPFRSVASWYLWRVRDTVVRPSGV